MRLCIPRAQGLFILILLISIHLFSLLITILLLFSITITIILRRDPAYHQLHKATAINGLLGTIKTLSHNT